MLRDARALPDPSRSHTSRKGAGATAVLSRAQQAMPGHGRSFRSDAREEQGVPSTDRCDVEDGDRPLGLDNCMRCSAFCDDLAERARQPLWPVPDHCDSNREVPASLRNSGLQSTDCCRASRVPRSLTLTLETLSVPAASSRRRNRLRSLPEGSVPGHHRQPHQEHLRRDPPLPLPPPAARSSSLKHSRERTQPPRA